MEFSQLCLVKRHSSMSADCFDSSCNQDVDGLLCVCFYLPVL